MKLLFTLLFAGASLTASAQKAERLTFAALPVDSASHLVSYSAVVPAVGVTKEQLYLRAKEWAARSFVDSKSAARMDDKDAGTYITRGIIRNSSDTHYAMTLAIYTKDGRYKYVIDQISYTFAPSGSIGSITDEPAEKLATYGKINARYVDKRAREIQEIMPKLAAGLQDAMTGKAAGTKSDW